MSQDLEIVKDHELATEADEPKLKEPPMYKVVLLNDDYTPMDFVVALLQKFFKMSLEKATRVMMQVHTEGRGVCGIYTKEIAETRKAQVIEYARAHQHILQSDIEEVE